ncbi:I78 family peptidase inhibitor [Pseudomonas sp. JDS28PS106]|uniref:I78 family peptidase inhibitor n=1 Tax=Pseudomonas sp. JDS28PS106 TaxID=2497235 RepID=UPI002FD67A35
MTNEQIVQNLQYLIGSRYVPTVKAYISELTDRKRVVGPGEITTKEFDTNRLTVHADQAGLVSHFSFG